MPNFPLKPSSSSTGREEGGRSVTISSNFLSASTLFLHCSPAPEWVLSATCSFALEIYSSSVETAVPAQDSPRLFPQEPHLWSSPLKTLTPIPPSHHPWWQTAHNEQSVETWPVLPKNIWSYVYKFQFLFNLTFHVNSTKMTPDLTESFFFFQN